VELSSIFARIIQARRDSKAKEEDILQCFIDSRYEKVVHIDCMVIGIAASNLRRAANVSPRCDILYLTPLLLDQSLGSNSLEQLPGSSALQRMHALWWSSGVGAECRCMGAGI